MTCDDAMLEATRLLQVLADNTSVSPDTVVVIVVTRGSNKPLGLASNAPSSVVGNVLARSLAGFVEATFDNAARRKADA